MAEHDETATEEERRIAREMAGGPDPDPPGAEASAEENERRSLADLANEEPDAEDEPEQYTLFGTKPKINNKVGGGRVSTSHVKFRAKQEDLPGQFEQDDLVYLAVKGRVDKLEFVSTHDNDGNVTNRKRLHTITALKVEQMGHVPDDFSDVDGRASALLKALTGELEKAGVAQAAEVARGALDAVVEGQEQEG